MDGVSCARGSPIFVPVLLLKAPAKGHDVSYENERKRPINKFA
jgi:hypothetical protein